MKQCAKCKEWKEESEFYKEPRGKDGLRTFCKDCMNENHKKYYQENREKINDTARKHRKKWKKEWLKIIKEKFGSLACSKCGYNKCFAAIDFHHLNPNEKEKGLANLMGFKPTPERIKELDKGILLCCRCHKELHWGQNNA